MAYPSAQRPLLVNGERLRRADVERPRGGGQLPFVPFTEAETSARLLPVAATLQSEAAALRPELRVERVVFEATLLPNFLAASSLPVELFELLDVARLGTRYGTAVYRTRQQEVQDEPTKTLLLSTDDQGLERLTSLLLSTPGGAKSERRAREGLLRLADLHLPGAADVLAPSSAQVDEEVIQTAEGLVVWEAVLHPDPGSHGKARPASDEVIRRWLALVESLGGSVDTDWIRTAGSLTHMPVSLPQEAATEAARFNPLRALRHMPMLRRPRGVEVSDEGAAPEPPAPPNDIEPVLRVAVFDGGVDDASPYFKGRTTSFDLTANPALSGAQRHGTLVTSAVLYGHAPAELDPVPVHVDHYRVLPDTSRPRGTELYWLLDEIRAHVSGGDYDVVNLSLGPQQSVDDDLVDPWTAHLDQLAYENGVLFVVAAGNNGEGDAATGLNRVQVPADMVNGLGVGACATKTPPPTRASYSAVGPGRAGGRVRPSGVAFGGHSEEPFAGVDADGALLQLPGTSFAAPFVVHGLANLAAGLGSVALTPEVLRAFAVHFALPGKDMIGLGHGVLRSRYDSALDCTRNEVRVLYRGSIARDEYAALLLPLPLSVTATPLSIHYTLVTTSPVDSNDAVEYVQACLEPTLRPHALHFRFNPPDSTREKSVTLKTSTDVAEVTRLLNDGWTPSQEPVAFSKSGKAETVLRTEGKWDTVRDFKHRFTKPDAVFRPRLDLSHLSREAGALSYGTPDLDYALLVTLTGPSTTDLYAEARSEYSVLAPVTAVTATATVTNPAT